MPSQRNVKNMPLTMITAGHVQKLVGVVQKNAVV